MLNVKVTEVKDVDVSNTDTDSDSVESYEEQVPNSIQRNLLQEVIHLKFYQLIEKSLN